MANATYNKNSIPKENQVLVYNEASELMEWGSINKIIDKTYITIHDSADSAQTIFSRHLTEEFDSDDRVYVYVNGELKSHTLSGKTIVLDSAVNRGDEVRIAETPDSAEHLGIMYWNRNRTLDSNFDSVRWGTLIDLVDSNPEHLGIFYFDSSNPARRMKFGTLVDLVDSSPAHQDVPMYDSDTRRVSWGRASTMASAIFAIDTVDINTTPPAGSYVSGYGTVSGGGFASAFPMEEGVIYGPTDGTQITVSGSPGDYFLVTQPV